MNLNTSNVKVQQFNKITVLLSALNLNTSNVKVQPNIKAKVTVEVEFKYIQC